MSLANRRRAAVAVGGAIGAIGRALIIDIVGGSGLDPLWATLFANLTGSLALGLLVGRHTGRARSSMRCGRQASVSYTHLRAHETVLDLVCRLLLEKKKKKK